MVDVDVMVDVGDLLMLIIVDVGDWLMLMDWLC
jgi:hypothetical protein